MGKYQSRTNGLRQNQLSNELWEKISSGTQFFPHDYCRLNCPSFSRLGGNNKGHRKDSYNEGRCGEFGNKRVFAISDLCLRNKER
jgi:hypothetical protein